MKNCLLCGASFSAAIRFFDFLRLEEQETVACQDCFAQFEKISDIHCSTCCKNKIRGICSDCQYWENQGKEVRHKSLFIYNQAMKDYFSAYKFQGDFLLRKVFAQEIRTALKNYKNYTLVPIPVSSSRLQERGFNQVEGLLDIAGLPYKKLLEKKDSSAQSSKNRQERLNSEQAFFIIPDSSLAENILLVDDIYTTGTTLQLAKTLLSENGVKEIMTISLAR